jgi:tRNA(Ile)-lysidine synthetase-like protein
MPQLPPATPSKLVVVLSDLPQDLLVGVSGGIDSVTLLHALMATGRRPVVAHFDHVWRAESRADARWVRGLAQKYGLKFVAGKSKPSPAPRRREADARAARYAFFAQAARAEKIPDLVLAHNADDQVETFLLQLFRGSGAGGLGMGAHSLRDGLHLHRPWLAIWREEILAYARTHRLAWREDATNQDPVHRRNALRHRILPYLKKQLSPQLPERLWRAAEIARADGEWLDQLCGPVAPELDVRELAASPVARQRRIVRRWLLFHSVPDIDFGDVEAVRSLARALTPARVNLGGGRFARRRAGRIFLE